MFAPAGGWPEPPSPPAPRRNDPPPRWLAWAGFLPLLIMLAALGLSACASAPEPAPGKRIAITFDDAPTGDGPKFTGDERTGALIDALENADSGPAAFFVTTKGFAEPGGRGRVLAYAEAGHLIANHSDRHLWLTNTPLPDYLADLDTAEAKLDGLPNRRAWFRFPFLDEEREDEAKRDAMRAGLAERGLMNGYVTVDTYDWHMVTAWRRALAEGRAVDEDALRDAYVAMVVDAAEHYDRMAMEVLGRRPAQVLLLHENDLAALFVDDAIEGLRAAGWTIIGPDEAYEDPMATRLPETRFAGMGRVAALGYDQGLRGAETFDHWSADEAGIDTKLEEFGAFGPAD